MSEHRIVGVRVHLQDERLVDLHFGHRQPAQVRKRGVPRPEVVDRQADAEVVETVEHVDGELRLTHDLGLGDLQRDDVGPHTVVAQDLGDIVGQLTLEQVAGGDVHRQLQLDPVHRPLRSLGDCFAEHVARDLGDQTGALADGDELVRGDPTECRMVPSQQRFDGNDLARREIGLRLVVDEQLFALERFAQIGSQRQSSRRRTIVLVGVELHRFLGSLLGRVERHVRSLHQRDLVTGLIGEAGDADRRADD